MTEKFFKVVNSRFVTGHMSRDGRFVDVRPCEVHANFHYKEISVFAPKGVEVTTESFKISSFVEAEVGDYMVASAIRVVFEGETVEVTPEKEDSWRISKTEASIARDIAEREASKIRFDKKHEADIESEKATLEGIGVVVSSSSGRTRRMLRRWSFKGWKFSGEDQEIIHWMKKTVADTFGLKGVWADRVIRSKEFRDVVAKALGVE